ncbi:SRPBCC domain-containing protein [Sphingomonas koreensis]
MDVAEVVHETLVIERAYKAAPARVFDAWRDSESRARWTAPSDGTAVEFERFDFRTGGIEVSRCGAIGDLRYRVEVHYLDIVIGKRIVFAEAVSEGGRLMGAALITVCIEAEGNGSRLILTDQALSTGGRGYIDGSGQGYSAALENLAREVEQG